MDKSIILPIGIFVYTVISESLPFIDTLDANGIIHGLFYGLKHYMKVRSEVDLELGIHEDIFADEIWYVLKYSR